MLIKGYTVLWLLVIGCNACCLLFLLELVARETCRTNARRFWRVILRTVCIGVRLWLGCTNANLSVVLLLIQLWYKYSSFMVMVLISLSTYKIL